MSARAFIVGCNSSTLGFVSSLRPEEGAITAHLVPLAWTPLGVVLGNAWSKAQIPTQTFISWVDQTFPPDDDHAFVAALHDLELLARAEWHSELPPLLNEDSVLNFDDVPEEITDALAHPAAAIVQCAACRRLCVQNDFLWNDRQLCAWDYHATVFGKRGPWRNGAYEEHHFKTLPRPAFVAPPLLDELGVEVILATGSLDDVLARRIVNTVLEAAEKPAHLAVRTDGGYTILREAR